MSDITVVQSFSLICRMVMVVIPRLSNSLLNPVLALHLEASHTTAQRGIATVGSLLFWGEGGPSPTTASLSGLEWGARVAHPQVTILTGQSKCH